MNQSVSKIEMVIARETRLTKSKISILIAILWVAEADAPLTRAQFSKLLAIFKKYTSAFGSALVASERVSPARLEESLREIANQPAPQRKQILAAALKAATLNKKIGPAAWHTLALLADVCARGVGGEALLQLTCRSLKIIRPAAVPRPDLALWWKDEGAEWEVAQNELPRGTPQSTIRRMAAFQILGLEPTATETEIEKAFRQCTLALSPDQIDGRSVEVIKAARSMAKQLQEARKILKEKLHA